MPDDFDGFVRARTPALLRAAYLLTGDQYLAEDLVQIALVRTHRAWSRIREQSPEAYTRKVMYHQHVSWWRQRRGRETLRADPQENPGPARDEASTVVIRLTMREALQRLPARQRAVLVLRYFEDHTEAETAELLGVAVGTVKSQAARALARLRAIAPELIDSTPAIEECAR